MVSRAIYETLNIIPEYISSYDARCYGFPELMAIRTINKKGEAYTEKEIAKKKNHPAPQPAVNAQPQFIFV